MRPLGYLGLSICLVACAYPRRSTALSSVGPAEAANVTGPPNLVRVELLSAEVPPRQRGDLPWDEGDAAGALADPFVRVYRGEELLFESEPVTDTLRPQFAQTTDNLLLAPNADLRIELWDDDPGVPEPIGTWRGRGLPRSALPDARTQLNLEGGAALLFTVRPPEVHRGTGVTLYELHGSSLAVVEVLPLSPAGRAGIRPGDHILSIAGQTVKELGQDEAISALAMASSRRSKVQVRHRDGREEEVELDSGFTWQSR